LGGTQLVLKVDPDDPAVSRNLTVFHLIQTMWLSDAFHRTMVIGWDAQIDELVAKCKNSEAFELLYSSEDGM
jgi:hypothetical protein